MITEAFKDGDNAVPRRREKKNGEGNESSQELEQRVKRRTNNRWYVRKETW